MVHCFARPTEQFQRDKFTRTALFNTEAVPPRDAGKNIQPFRPLVRNIARDKDSAASLPARQRQVNRAGNTLSPRPAVTSALLYTFTRALRLRKRHAPSWHIPFQGETTI